MAIMSTSTERSSLTWKGEGQAQPFARISEIARRLHVEPQRPGDPPGFVAKGADGEFYDLFKVATAFLDVMEVRLEEQAPTAKSIDQKITDYPWPKSYRTRVIGACQANNIETFRDLCQIGPNAFELMVFTNFGRKSLNQVKLALATLDLRLGMSSAEANKR